MFEKEKKYLGNERGYSKELIAKYITDVRWFVDALVSKGESISNENIFYNVIIDVEEQSIVEVILEDGLELNKLQEFILKFYNAKCEMYPQNMDEQREIEKELNQLMYAIRNAAIDGYDYITIQTES